jgi:type IV fimbrial biogenesis protein FimT
MSVNFRPKGIQKALRGFTLVELMVTISIMGALAALAAPSFRDTIARYKTSSMADQMVAMLALARAEALRRGGDVYLEKMPNGSSVNTCVTNQEWSCGVFLWADNVRNQTREANADPALDEPILRAFDVPQGIAFRNMSAGSNSRILFNRWGQGNNIGALHFLVRYSGVPDADRSVCVSSGGRIRVAESNIC